MTVDGSLNPVSAYRGRWFWFFTRLLKSQSQAPISISPNISVSPGQTLESSLCLNETRSIKIPPIRASVCRSVQLDSASDDAVEKIGFSHSSNARAQNTSLFRSSRGEVTDDIPQWKRLRYLMQMKSEFLLGKQGPVVWPMPLFDYQIQGVNAIIKRVTLLLADDMGLGKTIQLISAFRILFLIRVLSRVLVIVPVSLVTQWRREINLWAPELKVSTIRGPARERSWQWRAPAHITLVGYETFRSDFTANPHSPPRREVWDAVVLDEAQKIKNPYAEVAMKCKQLKRKRSYALTGTPLENSIEDLESVLEFAGFTSETGEPVACGDFLALHREIQIRRKKIDVLPQLPPKIVTKVILPMETEQRQSYDQAEKEGIFQLKKFGPKIRISHILELIVKLKQICNVCPVSGQSAKMRDIRGRLTTLTQAGHRALVFSQFTDAQFGCGALRSVLSKFNPLEYTGAMTGYQRDNIIREFMQQEDHKVLILSLRAGGQGLNLQNASYVFHFDRWWNPAVEKQAEDRSHRMGQQYPVHVYKYTLENTIEERIENILESKQRLFDEVVDDVSLDLKTVLTSEELLGLFGLV